MYRCKYTKNKILKKTIATMLLFVMVFQFMPNIVIAVNDMTKNDKTIESLEKHITFGDTFQKQVDLFEKRSIIKKSSWED